MFIFKKHNLLTRVNKVSFLLLGLFFILTFQLPLLAQNETQAEQCQITNCQGLEIECGFSGPVACNAMYRLGDFCRQFAECQVVDGQCQFVSNEQFDQCKACVEKCEKKDEVVASFECESTCRSKFETDLNKIQDQSI